MTTLLPEVRRLLDTVLPARHPPFDAAELRAGHQASIGLLGGTPQAVHAVESVRVDPAPHWTSAPVTVRRFRPSAEAPGAIVWLHGGGWVVGSLDGFDDFARALVVATGRQVFLVDYRLAPEASYPAGIADCTAAIEHVAANAGAYGIDPARLVAGGDSAGGHLAITATRWLAAAGRPLPAALLLLYPVTDARMVSDSYGRYGDGHYLTAVQMAWFWSQFVPQGTWRDDKPVSDEHPDLSPILADDLGVLPQSLVVTAECDVLHDEGLAFARRLDALGVPCEHQEVPGMIHGFIRFRGVLPQADRTIAAMAAWLDRRGV